MYTNAIQNNVVGFQNESIPAIIDRFINKYEAANTRITYINHIDKMFMYVCGKHTCDITEEDIKNIEVADARKYQSFLRSKYKKTTVNQAIFSCKAMFDYIKNDRSKNRIITENPFDIEKIVIKNDGEDSYGSLTEEELNSLYDYCLSLPSKGMTKKLYFEMLATITCRKSVAQNLKMSDIKKKKNRFDGKTYYVIDTLDKTRNTNKAISDDFYNRLKENFKSYSDKDKEKGFVFNVENQTLEKTLNNFFIAYGIDKKERNLTQHSLKSTGLDIIYNTFQDIQMVADAAGHANINMAYKKYIGKNVDYSKQPSYVLSKECDTSLLQSLTKEEILSLIQSCGNATVTKLTVQAQKKGFGNESDFGTDN